MVNVCGCVHVCTSVFVYGCGCVDKCVHWCAYMSASVHLGVCVCVCVRAFIQKTYKRDHVESKKEDTFFGAPTKGPNE